MIVAHPVIDLRARPGTAAVPDAHDPLEESQLLYGEQVKVVEIHDGWAHIEALEQAEYSHGRRWQGYPGWIAADALVSAAEAWEPTIVLVEPWVRLWKDAYHTDPLPLRLPMGTVLRGTEVGPGWRAELIDGTRAWINRDQAASLRQCQAMSAPQRRQAVLRAAERLLGVPYYWGGRSPHAPLQGQVTGVDCSGLVNLAYRTIGMAIPRDSHEQHLRAKPVLSPQPADLIFLSAPEEPQRITHVMLYAGSDAVIEGPGTGHTVRRITLSQRLGRSLSELQPGTTVNNQTVYFGAYLE